MNLPDNPPDVISQPWNHITLVFSLSAEKVTFGNIVDRFTEQFDPEFKLIAPSGLWINSAKTGHAWRNVGGEEPGKYTVQVDSPNFICKIHSIRVWNLTGRAVSLTVYDYSNTSVGSEALVGIVDTGGINRFPAVGYLLPMSLRDYVLRSNDNATARANVFETTTGAGDRCMAYIRMEWRCDGPSRVPQYILTPSEKIHRDVRNANQSLSALLKMQETANEGISTLVDAQPSTMKKLFNGTLETAAFVAPLVLSEVGVNTTESLALEIEEMRRRLVALENIRDDDSTSSYNEVQLHGDS